ncbi:MAG: hypothetical protein JXB47_01430 [Anaerolineae bacterium]|nr:hypothetical protein [Anaerolineae bacterium]
MSLLIALLFAGLVLIGGGMLTSLWNTARRPGIALAGVLIFALFNDIAMGWAATAGFDAVAYALPAVFAVVGVAFAWRRRRHPRPTLPHPLAQAALGAVFVLYVAPTLVLPVPPDTDAQGFGYLALAMRAGGAFNTLAPFHPEISYLYSPAFPALAACVSAISGAGLHTVQFALGAALGFLFVWLAHDFGREIDILPQHHAGPTMLALAILGTGVFTAYLDSHYTTLTALVFALAFVTFVARYLRGGANGDALAAAVCLAAVPLAHPDTTIILMIGYLPWLLTIWLARPQPARRVWLTLALGIPLGALLLVVPWLLSLAPLLGSEIASPFTVELRHLLTMIGMSGVLAPALAAGGAVIAWRRRGALDLWMLTWLAAVIEFGALGVLGRLLPFLENTLLKYDYPFSIAWHGPIIPFLYLGTLASGRLLVQIGLPRVTDWVQRWGKIVIGSAAALVVLGVIVSPQLLALSKGRLSFFGAFSSHADVAAMQWLKTNAPPAARILNYGTDHEADWAAVIAERDAVFYRPQPFFKGAEESLAEQDALRGFWADPADPAWAAVLAAHDIDYVLVPQAIADPAAPGEMFRWRAPHVIEAASTPAGAPYLRLVYQQDGAAIYVLDVP